MAPKKQAAAQVSAGLPLEGCIICLSGNLGRPRNEIADLISSAGGATSVSITKKTSHLVCSAYEVDGVKAIQARGAKLPVLALEWIIDSNRLGKKQDIAKYEWDDNGQNQLTRDASDTAAKGRKRSAPANGDDDDDDADDEDKKKSTRSQRSASPTKRTRTLRTPEPSKPTTVVRKGAAPVDIYCGLKDTFHVLARDGEIYSATLNQVDAGKNASKAYFLQILVPDDGKGEPVVFTRWGRVGEPGQQKTIDVSNETHAISEFKSRFKSKTSFPWEARATAPSKPGKYTWLDVDFGHDDTEGADEQEEAAGPSRAPTASPTKKARAEAFPSKLSPSVQSLARLMFNQSIIDRTLAELKYDATKQPLGRIGGTTLKRALGVLSSISDALEQPGGGAQAQLQSLSNEYLSLIPHIFPRNTRPPVINNMEMVKNELDVLATLGEMEAGAKLMKSTTAGDVNPLDARIEGLKLNKLEVLEHDSKEFSILQDYALHTHGQTHQHLRYQVEDIFVVDRADDRANPLGNIGSKKLLWHGSRCSNWPGILSQGLRIAPPEAPVSGYMFGKGIYLADSMSKSAGYTYPHLSEDTGLLVLCEAELGKLLMLRHADYNADEKVKEAKAHSTLGMGQHIPASWKDCAKLGLTKDLKGVLMPVGGLKDDSDTDRSLMYNEYIVYNVEQVKFRYLFRIKFN